MLFALGRVIKYLTYVLTRNRPCNRLDTKYICLVSQIVLTVNANKKSCAYQYTKK